MVSWKTLVKEQGFYIYGIGLLAFLFLGFSVLKFVFDVDIVTFDTYMIVTFVLIVGIMVAVLAGDVAKLKRKLKKKGK